MKIFEIDDHKLILGDVLEVLGSEIPRQLNRFNFCRSSL
jgi:hypothetical protein